MYFAYNILRILRVDFIVLSGSKYLSPYEFIKDSYGLTVLSVIYFKSQLLTSTIGAEHPSYGTSPSIITLIEHLRSSPKAVSSYLLRIISYLLLVDSSMWHFHVTIFVALKSGTKNSTFTFSEVVNFLAWVSYIVFADYFDLIFDVSLPITIVELIPLSNRIWKFLNFAFPLRVFIYPWRIGE